MNDKIANRARSACQQFAENNISDLDGLPTIVPATTFLAIEAFGLAVAMYANEAGVDIDDAIGIYLDGMADAGARLAKDCHKYTQRCHAQAKAERTVEDIMAAIQK